MKNFKLPNISHIIFKIYCGRENRTLVPTGYEPESEPPRFPQYCEIT